MRLITGPLCSGKSTQILEQFKSAIEAGTPARLLVPTATMAEHVRNSLVRTRVRLRPEFVSTLAKFVQDLTPGVKLVSAAQLELLVDKVLRATSLYSGLRDFRGFRLAVVSAINELHAAGADAAVIKDDVSSDLHAIVDAVEAELAHLDLSYGHRRLLAAAASIRGGASENGAIFLDGFYSFTPGEASVLKALAVSHDLTVTLPEWSGAEQSITELASIPNCTHVRLSGALPSIERTLIAAPSDEAEANQIAASILKEHDAGRPYREMGVIIRSEQPYADLLRRTFERFGIPARLYFSPPLASVAVIEYLCGLVDLVLNEWDHHRALEVLRLSESPIEAAGDGDLFEWNVMSGEYRGGLETLAITVRDHDRFFEELRAIDKWRADTCPAARWVTRLATLPGLAATPDIEDRLTHDEAMLWRQRSQALVNFRAALDEAAELCGADRAISLREFFDALKLSIENRSIHPIDHRRDVVHVMDAFEARQWRLPVVFVAGLLEGSFPKHPSEDPLISDAQRLALRHKGFPMRTVVQRQEGERLLFDVAVSRSNTKLTLSYPSQNAKGDQTLRSFVLDRYCRDHLLQPEPITKLRPVPILHRSIVASSGIRAEDLVEVIRTRTATIRPTAIESYLQCPYRFFISSILKLRELPKEPMDRLDPAAQGTIAHEVLRVATDKRQLEKVLNESFEATLRGKNIAPSYRTEAVRLELLFHLRRFFAKYPLLNGDQVHREYQVEFELAPGIQISGRIDRIDISGGQATVIDFKYKDVNGVGKDKKAHEEGLLVQAGLYLRAAREKLGVAAAGTLYCGVKKNPAFAGWIAGGPYAASANGNGVAEVESIIQKATNTALVTIERIRSGEIAPRPADVEKCVFCSALNICRYESTPAVAVAGEAQ